ncbi:MAG: double zinc ribbon domain-containing protein, partial [Clostridiales Family XIII bacterium]|nr:double zinc ribbon domain-containing protein [Clostridiales Family XIII bacterium]
MFFDQSVEADARGSDCAGQIPETRRGFLSRLGELLFPSGIYCVACGNVIDETSPYALCDRCLREIDWNTGKVCAKCGKSLEVGRAEDRDAHEEGVPGAGSDTLCFDCEAGDRVFRRGYACVTYAGPAREIVRALKYRDRAYIAERLAEIMRDRILDEIDAETGEVFAPDLILPVPMYIIKKRKRGYDQAILMARRLALWLRIPCEERCLVRREATAVMSGLSRDARRRNVRDAFALREGAADRVAGRRVLLVDDVFTTG